MPTGITHSTEPEFAQIPYKARFIEITDAQDLAFEPIISVIRSPEQLQDFCKKSQLKYHIDSSGSEDIADFAELCVGYDNVYFENKYLVLLSFSEGSICTTHEIPKIAYGINGQMEIFMDAISEGLLLDQEGNWCCILEIGREYQAEAEDIKVNITEYNYPNGRPADS